LSIKREDWIHTYAYDGDIRTKPIPTQKLERKEFFVPQVNGLIEIIQLNQPCIIIGMGKLPMECLLGESLLNKKVGADWRPIRQFRDIGINKVWITHNPDAALFDPVLAVDLSWIIYRAALEANIPTKIDHNLKLFDWSKYL
jgi:hypothetical protein